MKKSSKSMRAFLVAALCIAMTSKPVWCASGDLDPSFGNGGKFRLADGSFNAVAFDANTGAIISVGNRNNKQLLVRTLAGQLDHDFGKGGVVVNPAAHSGVGLVILPDSKIVTAGSGGNRIFLSRYEANGAPDTSFGANGTVVRQVPPPDGQQVTATGLTIQPADGKLLIVGYAIPHDPSEHSTKMFLARFNLDGTIDVSFGNDGLVITDLGVAPDRVGPARVFGRAVGLQSTGKIVVVGNTRRFPQTSFVARFLPQGTLDLSFGQNGIAEDEFCSVGRAVAIGSASGINQDDRIIVAGDRQSSRLCALRFTPDGTLDSAFNGNGLLIFPSALERGELRAVIVSDGTEGPSGQIVVGGTTDTLRPTAAKFLLARINPNGSFDSTFGKNGIVTTVFSPGAELSIARGIMFYTGTIVAAGFTEFSEDTNAGMARYLQ
jgi:uncharacterized delta-60 repeat protein